MGSIQHMNLVQLLGYYIQSFQHMLVYEYMSNSSFDKLLFDYKLLDWVQRIHIVKGIIQGLAYLHHECNPRIVHIDIKPQNILLNENTFVAILTLGLRPKQGLTKARTKREIRESHFMLPRMQESVRE